MAASAELQDCLQHYLDGLYHCDIQALQQVFHPKARYVGAPEGRWLNLSMEEYLPMVAAREPGSLRGETRLEAIESMQFAGPDVAAVRLRCRIGPRFFTDFLSLVREQGRWRIVNKLFHTTFSPEQA